MEFVHTGECESLLNSVCCNNLYELFVRTPVLWGCSGNFFCSLSHFLFLWHILYVNSMHHIFSFVLLVSFSSVFFLFFVFSSRCSINRLTCGLSRLLYFISLPGLRFITAWLASCVACAPHSGRVSFVGGAVSYMLLIVEWHCHTGSCPLGHLGPYCRLISRSLASAYARIGFGLFALFSSVRCTWMYLCGSEGMLTRPVRVCVGSVLVSGRARYTLLSQWSFPSAESGTGVRLWLCDRLAEDTGRLPSRATTLYLTKVLIIC